jgi:hypothetical protein
MAIQPFQCTIDPPTAARRLLAEDGACLLELAPGLPANLSEVFVTAEVEGYRDVARLRLSHIESVKVVPRDASSRTLKRLVPISLNTSLCSTTGCAPISSTEAIACLQGVLHCSGTTCSFSIPKAATFLGGSMKCFAVTKIARKVQV